MAKVVQESAPGFEGPDLREQARELTNRCVKAVRDAEVNLRKARAAERQARAQEAALAAE